MQQGGERWINLDKLSEAGRGSQSQCDDWSRKAARRRDGVIVEVERGISGDSERSPGVDFDNPEGIIGFVAGKFDQKTLSNSTADPRSGMGCEQLKIR